ncbi:hypothetical protein B0T20DRAFT_432851 [Sordaria brevicollis]|uniref:Uncharacterized protein n=1 Tax=Sordaria brevicollis TaxID=83679 RepID=A0AAE0UED5_SORBR|nr:hypothetical protein B0T20DRAFT_432851 [Sordaria brevicollis]
MGPSSRLSSDLSLSPITASSSYFPSYGPGKEEHNLHEGQEEEEVGLLSATSTRLQHIASQRLPLFGKIKSCRPQARWHKAPPVSVRSLFFFLGVFIVGGVLGYYARGSHAQGTQDGVVEECRSPAAAAAAGRAKPKLVEELNGLVPEFEVKSVVFGEELLASANATADEEEEDWKLYMPAGKGFIAVDNPSQYATLPPPIEFHGQTIYSISVFHQLHCLHTIMQSYNALSSPNSPTHPSDTHPSHQRDNHHQHQSPNPQLGSSKPEQQHHTHSKNHINHCFRYLRQSLICCGDTALEGQDLHHSELKATNGEGAVHLCKDFAGLKAWAEGRRVI